MSPPIRDGSGNSIGAIRLGDGSEVSEVRTGAGDVLFSGSAIPDSATHQYKLDEGSGSTVIDSIGSNDLTNSGGTWESDSNAKGGYRISLDGSNDNINGPSVAEIGNDTAFSIAITLNPDNFDSTYQLFMHQDPDRGNMFTTTFESDGNIKGGVRFSGGSSITAGQSISTGSKQRIVYTYDGSSTVTCYVDKNASTSGGTIRAVTNNDKFFIGENAAGDRNAPCNVDNLIIADEEWSQSQVDDDYTRQPWT